MTESIHSTVRGRSDDGLKLWLYLWGWAAPEGNPLYALERPGPVFSAHSGHDWERHQQSECWRTHFYPATVHLWCVIGFKPSTPSRPNNNPHGECDFGAVYQRGDGRWTTTQPTLPRDGILKDRATIASSNGKPRPRRPPAPPGAC